MADDVKADVFKDPRLQLLADDVAYVARKLQTAGGLATMFDDRLAKIQERWAEPKGGVR